MDKQRIKEFKYLESALKQLRKEIKQLSSRAERSSGKVISDVSKGSSPEFPYIETRMKIESIDNTKRDSYLRLLSIREAEYTEKIIELEEWLSEIKDPLVYSIFKLKLRNNLTDKQIGDELGYSRSRITQIINDYLKD